MRKYVPKEVKGGDMLLRANSDQFVITRKKFHKGKMAPNGYLFLHVTYKCSLRNMKYSITKFIKGNQGENEEGLIAVGMMEELCNNYSLKLHFTN